MATQTVEFQYLTGLHRRIFRNARLRGSWSANGHYATDWTESPMQEVVGEDGCPMFRASVALDRADQHRTFRWGVVLDGPQGSNFWGIPTEVQDVDSVERYREFRLTGGATQVERYYFTYCRRLGANKHFHAGQPGPRPAVLGLGAERAERRRRVRDPARGYIADDGTGIDAAQPVVTCCVRVTASGKARPRQFRSVQEPSVHVPHRERAGTHGLSHRHLLAQPNRTGRDQSRHADRLAGYGGHARRHRRAAAWSSIPMSCAAALRPRRRCIQP